MILELLIKLWLLVWGRRTIRARVWAAVEAERLRYEQEKQRVSEFYMQGTERMQAEQAALNADLAKIEEQRAVAAAWRPFPIERKLNKSQMQALAEGMSTNLLQAIETLARERMRQLSNQAITAADGSVLQAKPMWTSVGVNMLWLDIQEASKLLARSAARTLQKEVDAAGMKPPPPNVAHRDVTHLYDNPHT